MQEKILVFRSNLQDEWDLQQISTSLNQHPAIQKWNVDLQDVDHVIRIVTPSLTVAEIEKLIQQHGYQCSELE